jgi:molybdopterin converting factor subunit 1
MSVRVLLFAQLRERAGGRGESLRTLPEGADVHTLMQTLSTEVDSALLARSAVAVNREYVARTHVLREGDEVAILPPVSGGASHTPWATA